MTSEYREVRVECGNEAVILTPACEGAGEAVERQTILLVEDEARVRHVMAEVLRMAGHCVLEAENAESAMRVAIERGQSLHLLVTDVVLPGRSGRDLARELQGRFPGMKAILVSGYGESVALMGAARSPALSYLPKPFSAVALMEVVAQLLGKSGQSPHLQAAACECVS